MWRIAKWGGMSHSRIVTGSAGLALLLAAGLVGASLAGPTAHAGTFEAVHQTQAVAPVAAATGYADLVARVAPSIVTVRSERMVKPAAMPFGGDQLAPFLRNLGFGLDPRELQPHREGGLGSGVIVSADGYHPHEQPRGATAPTKVRVELADRRSFDAKVVGTDAPSDLAVLKVDAQRPAGPALRRLGCDPGGRRRARVRQPAGRGPDRDDGHRQRQGPRDQRGRRQLRGLPADRRRRSTRATRAARW